MSSFQMWSALYDPDLLIMFNLPALSAVSEETCNEVESLVFDLFANLGATGVVKRENLNSVLFIREELVEHIIKYDYQHRLEFDL